MEKGLIIVEEEQLKLSVDEESFDVDKDFIKLANEIYVLLKKMGHEN